MKTTSRKFVEDTLLPFAIVAVIIYVVAAFTVFEVRHPWATKTETFLHTFDALTFQCVDYDEMRKR